MATEEIGSPQLWDKDNPAQQSLVRSDDRFKNLLNREAVRICNSLSMSSMWSVLRQLEVISEKQEQEMKMNASNHEMVVRLINHINAGPLWWMHSFLRACMVSNQDHILKVLKVNSKPYDDTMLHRPYPTGGGSIYAEPWRRDNPRQQSLVREDHRYKSVLNHKRVELCDAMDLAPLWPVLRQLEVISAKQEEEMKLPHITNSQMVHLLIDHINRGPMWKLHGLLQACTVSNQSHILDILELDSDLYDNARPMLRHGHPRQQVHYRGTPGAPRTTDTSNYEGRQMAQYASAQEQTPGSTDIIDGCIVEAVEDFNQDSRNDVYFLKGDKMVVLDASTSYVMTGQLVAAGGGPSTQRADYGMHGYEPELVPRKPVPLAEERQRSRAFHEAGLSERSTDMEAYINAAFGDIGLSESDKDEPESAAYSEYHTSNVGTNSIPMQLVYKAIYDSGKGSGNELEFNAGDLIIITNDAHCTRGDTWWLGKHLATGKMGFVPNNYLSYEKTIDTSMLDMMKETERVPTVSDWSDVWTLDDLHDPPVQNPLFQDEGRPREENTSRVNLEKRIMLTHSGQVWLGQWNEKKNVAIKIIQNDIENFRISEDAETIAKLDHANVVKLWDAYQENDIIYMITEYAQHGHLLHFLKQGDGKHYMLPELVDIAVQIADGMKYLEENNYIHRQLKACNVLIAANGCVKVYIKVISDVVYVNINPDQREKLSIRWTAPEAMNAVPTKKSVVWSYGIVLYELFTYGSFPFGRKSDAEVTALLKNRTKMKKCIPKPGVVPEELYQQMLACLAHKEKDRPSFEQLLDIRRFSVGDGDPFQYPIQKRLNLRKQKKTLATAREIPGEGYTDFEGYVEVISRQQKENARYSDGGYLTAGESPFLEIQRRLQAGIPSNIYRDPTEYDELPDDEDHIYTEVYDYAEADDPSYPTLRQWRTEHRPTLPPRGPDTPGTRSTTAGVRKYPYTVLVQDRLPADVDQTQKEIHLTAQEFRQVFKMTYAKFSQLPLKTKGLIRKRCGLD